MSLEADPSSIQKHVLFLGPFSSFSHAAAADIFPTEGKLHPAPDFPSIFRALQGDTDVADSWRSPALAYDYAVVPVCNSTNGSVKPVIDLLKRTADGTILEQLSEHGISDLEATERYSTAISADYGQPETESLPASSFVSSQEETYPDLALAPPYTYALSVHHHLYVHPTCPITTLDSDSRSKPEPPSQISSLHTHPQVWTQCSRFLTQHFPNPPGIDNDDKPPPSLGPESHFLPSQIHKSPTNTKTTTTTNRFSHASTSDAAAYVAANSPSRASDDTPPRWPAVICSKLAGTAYNLKCIATSIEDDREGNQTTFIVLTNSKKPKQESQLKTP